MYNTKDIEKILNDFNYFIDENTLSNFIKNWKIDPIYEDEDRVEFFDNLAIAKLKKGISLKSQGYSNEQIVYHTSRLLPEQAEVAKQELPKKVEPAPTLNKELKNVTIDVTSQTLQMLAEAITEKITSEIKDRLIPDVSLKKDNEELSKKVEELTLDNKKLAERVEELEKGKQKSFINFEYFKKFFN